MSDKKIIKDDIDVSKCQHYGKCSKYCYVVEELCSDNPNCYYKRLKRKQQECEELKKIINEAKNSNLDLQSFLVGEALVNEYEQQLDQLKAENEHLSEKEEEAKHYLEEAEKFKNCLNEIKEIAKKEVDTRMLFADEESFCDFNKILQKISECEVKNE